MGASESFSFHNRDLRVCFILDAELWGILDGLKLIQDKRYAGVIIEMDSLKVIKAIQKSSLMNSSFALIRRIHFLLANIGFWELQHIPKGYNKIIDCMTMAKMTFDTNYNIKVFIEILREVLAISTIF